MDSSRTSPLDPHTTPHAAQPPHPRRSHVSTAVPTLYSEQVAQTVVEALVDGGVREAVIAPGSRSAPLVYALAQAERAGRLRLHVRIDERSAAFTALGLALASGRPAVVVTTSGTAVGNLLPAVMEADHAGVQLVALTADRPDELQGTGANQTTVQDGIFPLHVRFNQTLSGDRVLPEDSEPLPEWLAAETAELHGSEADPVREAEREHTELIRATVSRALLAAQGFDTEDVEGFAGVPGVAVRESAPGPVHLNVRFRDPLVPREDEVAGSEAAGLPDAGPVTSSLDLALGGGSGAGAESAERMAGRLTEELDIDVSGLSELRTVVVAGHGAGPVAAAFATALGLPLFAEPSSNARFGSNAVGAYPLLLGSAGGLGEDSLDLAAQIEQVILFGRPTLTRQIAALLNREDLHTAFYQPEPVAWFEPGSRRERPVEDLDELAVVAGRGPAGWLTRWQQAGVRAQAAVEDALATRHDVVGHPGAMRTGQLVASTVRGPLVLGSSSVIRDVDLSWRPPTQAQSVVFANRGLAGIDGTVSTAAGIALATGERTVVLCGDLTLLHDTNGLLLGPDEAEPDLDIVVVNDTGGAIFAGLEHGEVAQREGMAPVVERFFGTPHGVDLEALCRAHGVEWMAVESEEGLVSALGSPVRGRRMLELRSDREARPGVRRSVTEAVRATFED
ncbi:2-succinyl-5-enolpyruvyl-6-hydroxy-3-cyclohexene-1-carboxylate synthase [Micrococcus terreus]|uniref:2-succinyl-5-enolpyruvyl-6-hydroxy-3- cyclohexene-1-carboxylate synthase n=1 Tax=Micrococcus terreus TaxID=574650 RepID=UPI00255110A8|nr:thiamine pyrophosphate-binding protein [Micrococcus terreus]MDK7700380.1 thiamine pyrophosphate-binding protein [Micrococcus terreus]WOO96480.1 thiamine pyrophosphate-binding protein [Micrococcus terreus]